VLIIAQLYLAPVILMIVQLSQSQSQSQSPSPSPLMIVQRLSLRMRPRMRPHMRPVKTLVCARRIAAAVMELVQLILVPRVVRTMRMGMLTVLVTMNYCPSCIRSLRSGESALTITEMACFIPVIGILPVKTTICALRGALTVKVMELAQVISVTRRALTFLGMALITAMVSILKFPVCFWSLRSGDSALPPTEETICLPAMGTLIWVLKLAPAQKRILP